MNNSKTVFFAIGVLLIILGAFMFIPFFVQFIYDEKNNTFISSALITAFIGTLLMLTNKEENKKLQLLEMKWQFVWQLVEQMLHTFTQRQNNE